MAQRPSFVVPEPRSASTFKSFNDRSLHLPGPSVPGNTDVRPYPIEPDLNSTGISLPVPSSSLIDSLSDLQTPGHNRSSHSSDSFVRPSAQDPFILDWFSAEKPWDPIQGRNPTLPRTGDSRTGAKLNYRHSGPAFSEYLGSNVPSDCETTGPRALPSDSGYESRTRQSVVNSSIYGDCDRTGETGSIASHLAGLQFDRPAPLPEPWRQPGSVTPTEVPVNVDTTNLVCPTCKIKAKTRSELKKHRQKHDKPHHCNVRGCHRTEGFSTTNDVDRHKRSCHPDMNQDGKYYRCTAPGCRAKDKKWPRADNFRQHLKRLHHIDARENDLEAYIWKDAPPSGPDFAGLGTSVGDDPIPMAITQGASVLNPSNWHFFDQRIGLQAVQEQGSGDPCAIAYLGSQIDFQQDAAISHHHLQLMSPNGAESQISQSVVQMSSVGLGPENILSQLGTCGTHSQEHQALTDSADTDPGVEFIDSDYLNEESLSEKGAPENGTQFGPHTDDAGMSSTEQPDQEPTGISLSVERDAEETRIESGEGSTPHNAVTLDEDASPDAVSTATSTSGSNVDQRSSNEDIVPAPVEQPRLPESPRDGLDIINDKNKASDLIQALEDKGDLADLLEKHGYRKPRDAETRSKTAPSVRTLVSDNGQVCPEPSCEKVFPRPCELKKHMKRHEKPYGCTFPQCPKRFGSKNDWKRHENSQHYQLELWKCNEMSRPNSNEPCGKACHRREQFKAHMLKDHDIDDPTTINVKLEECLIGHNFNARFWCGFCSTIIQVKTKEPKAWTERFNHIDDHFTGRISRKMDISEWKSEDQDESRHESSEPPSALSGRPKRPTEEETQQSRPRKRVRTKETIWFCCQCRNPSLTSTTNSCFMVNCNGHSKCDNCEVELLPGEQHV